LSQREEIEQESGKQAFAYPENATEARIFSREGVVRTNTKEEAQDDGKP
jgi:hypothetical protein